MGAVLASGDECQCLAGFVVSRVTIGLVSAPRAASVSAPRPIQGLLPGLAGSVVHDSRGVPCDLATPYVMERQIMHGARSNVESTRRVA